MYNKHSTARVFLSYRKSDAPFAVDLICLQLINHFGKRAIFRDEISIPPGTDFRVCLKEALAHCEVLLAIIGENWKEGIHNPEDYVRLEIETALQRGIHVVPIFIGNAAIPDEGALPPSLASLPYKKGIRMRSGADFAPDFSRLALALESVLQ